MLNTTHQAKWTKVRLGDVCQKIGSGATPRGGNEVYWSSGVALIRSQNVYNNCFAMDGLALIGDEHARLVESVRRNVTIDWTLKESARAKLRTVVKRLLRKHGYPPDKQEKATKTVLEQAEIICKDWAAWPSAGLNSRN